MASDILFFRETLFFVVGRYLSLLGDVRGRFGGPSDESFPSSHHPSTQGLFA